MNIIKRHKSLAIIGGLTLILLIVMFAIISKILFSNGESVYGQRLKNLVKIEKSLTNQIIEETKEIENIEDIEIRTQGKIVRTIIKFKAGTNLDKAKEIANNTLTKYEENITGYYDFEYILEENIKDNEETEEIEKGFTIFGTKHPKNNKISWTKQ